MKKKKVAIIIPFISLNDYVFECIKGCFAQSYSNFEIILLPDLSIKLPKEYKNKRIKIFVTGDKNIAEKRNIGIKKSFGVNFFAFIDSDAYPHPDWLKNALNKFERLDKIWAVGGPNLSPSNISIYEKAVGNALKSFLLAGLKDFRKKIAKNRYCLDLPTVNLVVKRETIDFLNGFDKEFITGEDMDFCNRIIKHGGKILYHNKVIVYHHNRLLFKPFILQRITYGLSVFRIFKRSFSLSNLFLFIPLLFLLFIIFGFITSFFSDLIKILLVVAVSFYFLILLIESFRNSLKISEVPLTFVAFLLGNFMSGIGSLLALLRIKINIKKIYKNFVGENKIT